MEKIIILLVIFIVIQWAAFFFLRYRRKKELERLTEYLMKVQDSRELPSPGDFGEGAAGILGSEIYKLIVQMKEQTDVSQNEKEYLADMLANISHQIKTPLTSMGIMVDLLKTPELSDEARIRYVSNIERQTERMTWLIKSLLTLSQIDASLIRINRKTVNLKELLCEVTEPFELMAELKGVEIKTEVDGGIELECDRRWMAEALSNIVKNGLEHTGVGGTVRIYGEKNNFSVNIYIRDDGEGLEQEELGHIFERFYKGKNSSDNSVGIGLALSKQLIMLQNGVISAKSENGAGMEFHIEMYSDVNI